MQNLPRDSRRFAWLIYFILVLIWNIPNFIPWERELYPATYWMDMQERLFKCLLLAAIFLSLFSRPWLAWLMSWVVGLWWLPVSVAVRYLNSTQISSNLVGIAMASSPGELHNLILSIPPGILIGLLVWIAFGITGYFYLKRYSELHWERIIRLKISIYATALLAVPLIAESQNKLPATPITERNKQASIDPFEEGDRTIGTDAELPRAFPYELPWAVAQYWRARSVVEASIEKMHGKSPEHSPLARHDGTPDVLVLVIGESSSRHAWNLFNPTEVMTTPRLKARVDSKGDIFPLANVIAQTISTRQAVPSMLTKQPLIWPDGTPNPDATRSILSLAAEAGYSTAWLSNQAAIGQFDGVIAAYAQEASVTAFLNPASFTQQGSYDEILLQPLQRHLQKFSRSFVILHTMGSHFRFEHRYPARFGPFLDPENENEAYRNSIAYTDYFLEKVIAILDKNNRSAVMIYTSDHGQGLPNERCSKPSTNRITADSYEIPALVWLSKSYMSKNPLTPQLLRSHKNEPYTNEAIHETLLDFLNAKKIADTTPTLSTDRSSFIRRAKDKSTRMVVSPGTQWIDYDLVASKDACLIRKQ
jgi:glucan phosphoethanolaminetransferase (alkaline phosphatase superfamily)